MEIDDTGSAASFPSYPFDDSGGATGAGSSGGGTDVGSTASSSPASTDPAPIPDSFDGSNSSPVSNPSSASDSTSAPANRSTADATTAFQRKLQEDTFQPAPSRDTPSSSQAQAQLAQQQARTQATAQPQSQPSQIASRTERAAQVATGTGDAARAANGPETAARATPLRQGTAEFDAMARETAAREELARRLRGSGTTPGMPPEQVKAQINKLETDASVNRSKMAMAEPPVRPSVTELTKSAGQELAKLSDADFAKRALGYPKDLTQKFKPAEIESMRIYLGNEVRGHPVDKKQRFVQSDLIGALYELSHGFTNVKGETVPPNQVTCLNYQHINGELRGIRPDLTPGQVDRVKDVVQHMGSAFEKSTLTEPATVYRVNGADWTKPDADGLILADKGFQSTGRTPQLGFAKGDPKQYTLQVIELDKGQKLFDMDALTQFNGDLESFRARMPAGVAGRTPFGEHEMLLPRNTQLRVVDQWPDPASGMNVQRVKVVR